MSNAGYVVRISTVQGRVYIRLIKDQSGAARPSITTDLSRATVWPTSQQAMAWRPFTDKGKPLGFVVLYSVELDNQ
jgi:hypothetical protein